MGRGANITDRILKLTIRETEAHRLLAEIQAERAALLAELAAKVDALEARQDRAQEQPIDLMELGRRLGWMGTRAAMAQRVKRRPWLVLLGKGRPYTWIWSEVEAHSGRCSPR